MIRELEASPQSDKRDNNIFFHCGRMKEFNCGDIPAICTAISSSGTTSSPAACKDKWNGTFKGNDVSEQTMTVTLTQTGNSVEGGWTFKSTNVAGVPIGQDVKGTITPSTATVSDDGSLTGKWTQDKGTFKPGGSFTWKWKGNCQAFS